MSLNMSQSFFSKLNAKSLGSTMKPQRKARQYVLFHNLIINPDLYEGRDSLVGRTYKQEDEGCSHYTNPKSSFYLCKKVEPNVPFQRLPRCIIRRVAYRKQNKADQWGRIVYNDAECKNFDQVATEFHCYKLMKKSPRTIQMQALVHENFRSTEDRKLFYQVLKLPDRRAQGIRNIMFVLEEMNGGSLKEQIDRITAKKQDPFTEHQVIQYSCQIAQGLQELKLRGIIHRDLRPENILFHDKQIKISDFDSAFIKGYSDYRNIRNGVQMKDTTPLQIMELIAESEDKLKKLTSEQLWAMQEHADVYFLGVNIYTMVFSHAFQSFNGGKILANLINIKKRNGFNGKLLDVMARCLEKDAHKRITLEEVVRILGEIERETYLRDSTYTHIYLSSDPLNLYSFSSNQIEQKLQLEAADFIVYRDIVIPALMERDLEDAIRDGTVERNTKYYESIIKDTLQEKENESLWYDNPAQTIRQTELRKLRATIEQALERLQIKAFYYELTYRILCEVGLNRLAVQAEGYYSENIHSHMELLNSELVVILTFLYDMILKCSFTEDPYYVFQNIGYQNRRVFDNIRVLYARRSFFGGRKQALTNSFNINELTKKLEEFKAEHEGDNSGEVEQVENGVKFVISSIKKVEKLEKLVNDFHDTEYENSEKRQTYWYEYTTLMRFLDRIERVVKDEMVQTIINLIIAYEKLKTSKRGSDPALKNAIFMLMIIEAQNTNKLQKNDLVIIKEELTKMINLRIGWKAEELDAFFTNFTQVHQEQVAQGLHQLESQAVLGGGLSTLTIEHEEDKYEVKVEQCGPKVQQQQEKIEQYEVKVEPVVSTVNIDENYEIKVEQPPKSASQKPGATPKEEPKMEVKVSIEQQKEKEGNVSFQVEEHEQIEEDDEAVPEIKVINPGAALKKSETFEFQFQDSNLIANTINRSSIPVEHIEQLDS